MNTCLNIEIGTDQSVVSLVSDSSLNHFIQFLFPAFSHKSGDTYFSAFCSALVMVRGSRFMKGTCGHKSSYNQSNYFESLNVF